MSLSDLSTGGQALNGDSVAGRDITRPTSMCRSQAQRTRAADQFRAAKRGIMFSSDVSARGVDYPDVSLVIQVSTWEHCSSVSLLLEQT